MTVRKEVYSGLRYKIYERDNFTCRYCGVKLTYENITLDHIVPCCLNGKNNPSNLVTCCHPCNRKKGSKLLSNTNMILLPTEREVVKWQNHRWKMVILQLQTNY